MELRRIEAHKKRPTGLIVAAVSLVLIVGGLAWFLIASNAKNEAEQKAKQAQLEQAQHEAEQAKRDVEEMQKQLSELQAQMEEAQKVIDNKEASVADIAAAKKRLADLKAKASKTRTRMHNRSHKPKDNGVHIDPKCITEPNNPDC